MTDRRDVLIIGGYGNFGRFLAESLVDMENLRLWIGGRNHAKAWALADQLRLASGSRHIYAVQLDATDPRLAEQLKLWQIDLVIHTSGPFQGQSYSVAEACLEAKVHYVDLADGRKFVNGIRTLDERARECGVALISGASSVPALSAAVVDDLAVGLTHLESIETSISPGNQTPTRGLATVSAILSYTGSPIKCWEQGEYKEYCGWQDLKQHDYAGLGRRWVSRCEVPDLDLMVERYPGVKSVRFYAGLELKTLHFGMWIMSWLRRAGIVRDWQKYTKGLIRMSRWLMRFGTDEGGMRVEVQGKDRRSRSLQAVWTLIARNGHGPRIPTMAATLLAKKFAGGEAFAAGAYPCAGILTLADFETEFSKYAIEQKRSVEGLDRDVHFRHGFFLGL